MSVLSTDSDAFRNKTVNLTTDVDLEGRPWTPSLFIGGTFDGGNHVIYNMSINRKSNSGLFSGLASSTLRNVSLLGAEVVLEESASGMYHGIAAGNVESSSVIQNVYTSGAITVRSAWGLGGIGGVAGVAKGNSQIIGCGSDVNITRYADQDESYDDYGVGGVVGYAYGASITDCYFIGSLTTENPTTYVGGVVGYAEPETSVSNCYADPESLSSVTPQNAFYIGALISPFTASSCLWPEGELPAIASDVEYDESDGGHAVSDFSDPALVDELNENDVANPDGDAWRAGVGGHPVLWWQTGLVAADYSAVDDALAQIPADLSLYTAESATAVEAARDAVDRTLTADQQAQVDAMADAIEAAVAALERLADYGAVDAALAKAEALDRSPYTEGTLADLDAAVAAVERGYGETRQAEVDAMADAIEAALAGLEEVPAPEPTPAPQPEPEPEQGAGNKGALPATGDPAALLAPAIMLVGGTVLLARRRVA